MKDEKSGNVFVTGVEPCYLVREGYHFQESIKLLVWKVTMSNTSSFSLPLYRWWVATSSSLIGGGGHDILPLVQWCIGGMMVTLFDRHTSTVASVFDYYLIRDFVWIGGFGMTWVFWINKYWKLQLMCCVMLHSQLIKPSWLVFLWGVLACSSIGQRCTT